METRKLENILKQNKISFEPTTVNALQNDRILYVTDRSGYVCLNIFDPKTKKNTTLDKIASNDYPERDSLNTISIMSIHGNRIRYLVEHTPPLYDYKASGWMTERTAYDPGLSADAKPSQAGLFATRKEKIEHLKSQIASLQVELNKQMQEERMDSMKRL